MNSQQCPSIQLKSVRHTQNKTWKEERDFNWSTFVSMDGRFLRENLSVATPLKRGTLL